MENQQESGQANEGGGNQQGGEQEPIIIETPIDVDWGKKDQPQPLPPTDQQTEKK